MRTQRRTGWAGTSTLAGTGQSYGALGSGCPPITHACSAMCFPHIHYRHDAWTVSTILATVGRCNQCGFDEWSSMPWRTAI